MVTLPKSFWPRVLGSVVIQLCAGECTPSVDRAYSISWRRKLRGVSHYKTSKHQCTRLGSEPNLNSQASSPITEGWKPPYHIRIWFGGFHSSLTAAPQKSFSCEFASIPASFIKMFPLLQKFNCFHNTNWNFKVLKLLADYAIIGLKQASNNYSKFVI